MSNSEATPLKVTPLDALHRAEGAKMGPFAGYDMPIHYKSGIIREHKYCRSHAGLFDVSHMGQARLGGKDAVKVLEALTPGDIAALKPGQQRYAMFTNDQGGILDDLMVANAGDHLFLVVNAARKDADFAHIQANLSGDAKLEILEDRALIALQGPNAARILSAVGKAAKHLMFMEADQLTLGGISCWVSRSGYTGEDGFEISCPADGAEELAGMILAEKGVAPAGLGARDSLRLEAGLCLHGSDIDETTTPVEAALSWSISKRRRADGAFRGATVVRDQLIGGTSRKRVGVRPEGKAPARAGAGILNDGGRAIGEITSGGFSPTLEAPISMGYVETDFAKPGTKVFCVVRGRKMPAKVVTMPFVPHNYHKG